MKNAMFFAGGFVFALIVEQTLVTRKYAHKHDVTMQEAVKDLRDELKARWKKS